MNDEFSRYIRGLGNLRTYLKDNKSDQQLIGDAELLQMRLEREISEARKFGGEPRDREINKILEKIIVLSRNNTDKDFAEWCDGVYNAYLPLTLVSLKNESPPDRASPTQPNESDPQSSQIHTKLKTICEQFAQCQQQAEQAEQHLTRQRHFTPAQSKRAVYFLSDLSEPIRVLSELLRHMPPPSIIAPSHHNISLTLYKIEKENTNLQLRIDEENKQNQIIHHICVIKEQIKETIGLLEEALATAVLPSQENGQLQATTNILFLSLPEARTGNFDPRLGVRRLYDLFKDRSIPLPEPLGVLEARLERNLQKELFQGQSPTNSAEWAEILHSLIQMAAIHLSINFNDLCYP